MGRKALSHADFILRATQVRGNELDFSNTVYNGMQNKICVVCKNCGYKFSMKANDIMRGHGCSKCNKGRPKYTKSEVVERCNHLYGDLYDYSYIEYTNIMTPVLLKCNTCNKFFKFSLDNFLNGRHGCPYCNIAGKPKLTQDEFITKCTDLYGDLYDYSLVKYSMYNKKVTIICNTCHNKFHPTPSNFISGGTGCPYCALLTKSKGESLIEKYLISNNIAYTSQHRFLECKDKKPLPFDFYLPDSNICIEFDGVQHFDVNRQFMGNHTKLFYNKTHDKIKTQYCKNNGIKLIRITYKQINEIDNILDRELGIK